MTTYYKATRPDGTDFYAGTVDYAAALASGAVIHHPAVKSVKGDASTYLSVATVPTDCTGMRWPCRLFVVEPVGRALRATVDLPNKRRLSALRVVEERPAHEALGPQGAEVAALIEQAKRLTQGEVTALYAAWYARYAAWDAARGAAWDAARDAARGAAWGAAWDAAWALVVRDLIIPEQFDTLYGPWASVIEGAA